MTTICLISRDLGLNETCRAVTDEVCRERCEIRRYDTAAGVIAGADIYIWDSEATPLPPPMAVRSEAINLVVASRERLTTIRTGLPHDEFVFLQTPVTRFALQAFIEAAMVRIGARRNPESEQAHNDRDRILQHLLDANLKLQDVERDRTNFIMRIGHDIRVPLMAAEGYCGLLLADQFGKVNVEQRCILEKMQRSLARLEGLAAAMLDWSAGGGAVASMQLETGDLEPIVSQAVHEMGPGMKQKQIGIKVELEPARGSMLLDAAQLERVVVNLLENSCKFTPKHGSIEIRGYSVSGDEMKRVSSTEFASGYRIDVSDTGPGIDPQQVHEMFEEYASYGGCTDRGGAGLGLAICRTIIKAHKGRIWAASGQPGAVFSFFLPYSHFHRSERSSGSIVEASL